MKEIEQLQARRKPGGPITVPSITRIIVAPDGTTIVPAAGGWRRPSPIDIALASRPILRLAGFRIGD